MPERLLTFLTAPIPRPLLLIGAPILALLLVTLFVFTGFPYEVLADRALLAIEEQTNARIRYGGLDPRVTIGGPGFRFDEIDVTLATGAHYSISPAQIRPAWSLSWFRGRPALRADLDSNVGAFAGIVTIGSDFGWQGHIEGLDLSRLPLGDASGLSLSGTANVEADIEMQDGIPEGSISIDAIEGEFVHPNLPIAYEYDTMRGAFALGGEHLVRVQEFELQGPLARISIDGHIGHSQHPGTEPLALSVDLVVVDANIQSMARNLGLELDDEGRTVMKLSGTPASPRIQ